MTERVSKKRYPELTAAEKRRVFALKKALRDWPEELTISIDDDGEGPHLTIWKPALDGVGKIGMAEIPCDALEGW